MTLVRNQQQYTIVYSFKSDYDWLSFLLIFNLSTVILPPLIGVTSHDN